METKKDIFHYLKPKTENIPNNSYFEQLAEKIIVESKKGKIVPIYRKPIFWISSAAAIILVLLLLAPENTKEADNSVLIALNEVSKDEVMNYVSQHIEDFDAELVCEFIPIERIKYIESNHVIDDIQKLKPDSKDESIIDMKGVSSEDIINYIENEEIDLYESIELTEIYL